MKFIPCILVIILGCQTMVFGMGIGEIKVQSPEVQAAIKAYTDRNIEAFKNIFNKINEDKERKTLLTRVLFYPLINNDSYDDTFKVLLSLFSDEDIRYLLSLTQQFAKFQGKEKILREYVKQKKQRDKSEWISIQSGRLQEGMHYRPSYYNVEELIKLQRK